MEDSRKGIGILGGSFDPVHNGHLAIAESFLRSGFISELWILLTPDPPHKPHKDLSEYDIRLKMLKAAFRNKKNILVKDFESHLPKPSYSIHTLEYLKRQYPEKKLYLCIGEDSFNHFESWHKWNEILTYCNLLVARRPSAEEHENNEMITQNAQFVSHSPINISSTDIRHKVAKGESISALVPKEVEALISKNNLYKDR
ncbi:MAG TPA: nicotinate (nicotinamide) nucleotide adenylyltransferase [Balneolaceae bacterium]|nr:nicotinate (nicotinamide) nucleotide adenylyltransferase [Balneolaceae bacterium]